MAVSFICFPQTIAKLVLQLIIHAFRSGCVRRSSRRSHLLLYQNQSLRFDFERKTEGME